MFVRREKVAERRKIDQQKEENETSLLLDFGDSRTKLRISSFVGKVPARRIRPTGKDRVVSRTEKQDGTTDGWVGGEFDSSTD